MHMDKLILYLLPWLFFVCLFQEPPTKIEIKCFLLFITNFYSHKILVFIYILKKEQPKVRTNLIFKTCRAKWKLNQHVRHFQQNLWGKSNFRSFTTFCDLHSKLERKRARSLKIREKEGRKSVWGELEGNLCVNCSNWLLFAPAMNGARGKLKIIWIFPT